MSNVAMRVNQILVFSALMGIAMAGCGKGFFDSGIDSSRDEQGNVILLDTQRMWEDFIFVVDNDVANEAEGKKPTGGRKSWQEKWLSQIRHIEENQENPQKYIDYIIQRRELAQLPPLKGYPEDNTKNNDGCIEE